MHKEERMRYERVLNDTTMTRLSAIQYFIDICKRNELIAEESSVGEFLDIVESMAVEKNKGYSGKLNNMIANGEVDNNFS